MFKIITTTAVCTAAALCLTGWLMLNTILGTFGLVATSVEQLAELTQAGSVLEKMKARNKSKRNKAGKKFVKRSGAKVASTALAASTIGTVAVISAVVVFEIDEYCDETELLLEEKNLLFGTADVFDREVCIAQAREDSKAIVLEAKDVARETIDEQWSEAKTFSDLQWQQLRASTQEFLRTAKGLSAELWDEIMALARDY